MKTILFRCIFILAIFVLVCFFPGSFAVADLYAVRLCSPLHHSWRLGDQAQLVTES